ncbi:MAG: FAD:protein FMN transferase [Gemmatimonadetes bacterium]|nr:FAD:protein FMN transferase [Gemmatimonadota bacterium]
MRVERVAWVMGTRLRVVVDASSRTEAAGAAEAALREIERVDALLSTWDPASAMAGINDAEVGRAVPADPELIDLLCEAEGWARRTDRAFEPAVGALVDAWDLRGDGRRPSASELERALGASGAGAVRADRRRGTVVRVAAGAWIDTGGFGKGAALRSAGRILDSLNVPDALLDLGGQVLVVGDGGGDGWSLDVAHPARRHEAALRLRVRDVSVATSGASERWVEVEGERLGHLLDPRSGQPVPAWGSVTVVAADALAADALATALFVLGPDAALAWARDRDEGVLIMENEGGRALPRWNRAMEPWLEPASEIPNPNVS